MTNCSTCGRDLREYEIRTTAGDLILAEVERCCTPCCPFCLHALDDTGHCSYLYCWAWTLLIPLPEVRRPVVHRPDPTMSTRW